MNRIDNSIVVLVAIIVFSFLCFPIAEIASFDLRIADAFNTDEVEFLQPMLNAFYRGDFNIGRFDYGLFYYNIGLLCFYVSDFISPLTEHSAIMIMRLLSSFFLIANAFAIRAIYHSVFKSHSLLVFVLSILSSHTMLNYGAMVHPDLAQVFLVSMGVLFAIKYLKFNKFIFLLIAALFSGLAFATKFVGIAFLPVLLLLALFIKENKDGALKTYAYLTTITLSAGFAFLSYPSWVQGYLQGDAELVADVLALFKILHYASISICLITILALYIRCSNQFLWIRRAIESLSNTYLVGLIFCVGFSIGSPQSIIGFRFLNGLIYVAGIHKDGHWFRDESGWYGWVKVLIQSDVVPVWLAVFGILGLIWVIVTSLKSRRIVFLNPMYVPILWILMFCLVVVFRVKSHFSHYLIPVIPFLFLYASAAINAVLAKIIALLNLNVVERNLSVTISLVLGVWFFYKASIYTHERVEEYTESAELRSGEWIKENLNNSVSITADKYVYIPYSLNSTFYTYWGLSNAIIEKNSSDYLLINEHTHKSFLNRGDVVDYLHGDELFLERNDLYISLINDTHKDYKLVRDFGRVKLYKKRPPNGDL